MQFSYELLTVSCKHRLYLIHVVRTYRLGETTSTTIIDLLCTSLKRNSRWSFSCSELTCWLPTFLWCLGFNLAPSTRFFLFSPHITLRLISSLCCSSSSFMVFQQFSFFVAWLHHVYIPVSRYAYLLCVLISPCLKTGVLRTQLIIIPYSMIYRIQVWMYKYLVHMPI